MSLSNIDKPHLEELCLSLNQHTKTQFKTHQWQQVLCL